MKVRKEKKVRAFSITAVAARKEMKAEKKVRAFSIIAAAATKEERDGRLKQIGVERVFSASDRDGIREYCKHRSGVYIIRIKSTGQVYVGSGIAKSEKGRKNETNKVYDRVVSHLQFHKDRSSELLEEAIREEGQDNVEVIIVKTFDRAEAEETVTNEETRVIEIIKPELQKQPTA